MNKQTKEPNVQRDVSIKVHGAMVEQLKEVEERTTLTASALTRYALKLYLDEELNKK